MIKINKNIDKAIEKSIRFERPDYIPMTFHINNACWTAYPQEALWDLMESHPFLFPDFVRPKEHFVPSYPNVARKDQPYVDDWGCTWETTMDGITGTVTKHPLNDWSNYETYRFPDPEVCMGIGSIDWEEEKRIIKAQKANKQFVNRGLRHGHTFLQITDICGYTKVIYDMYDEEPLLQDLLDKILAFNMEIIRRYLDLEVDMISVPEDLGMQHGAMISPEHFRRYILPCYQKMAALVKERGKLLHMHSDGDIRTLVPGLMECGMDVLNLQDLVNGIDWIRDNLKGKICVELDIDRQDVTAFGTPKQVEELIAREVKTLGSPQGGLMMIYGLYPETPLENARAVMDAMEKYAFYFS